MRQNKQRKNSFEKAIDRTNERERKASQQRKNEVSDSDDAGRKPQYC